MLQKNIILFSVILGSICLLISSCQEPNPLLGTWSDNSGNTISFYDDETFNVQISTAASSRTYDGNYTVLLNSLTFTCTSETLTVVTEWDIRGNMLYLDWPLGNNNTSHLTLFKTAN